MATKLGTLAAGVLMDVFVPEPRHSPTFQGFAKVGDYELAVHSFGNGQVVHRDDVDVLIAGRHYAARNGDNGTLIVEHSDGQDGPSFKGQDGAEWWEALEPLEVGTWEPTGL